MLISILRTIILYAFVVFALRLMGKRQISDMQPSDLVVTLIVSDIAAIPMQNTSQPIISGIAPVLVLVALEVVVSVFMMKSVSLGSALRICVFSCDSRIYFQLRMSSTVS